MKIKKLDRICKPETIAVIGASSKKGSVGYSILKGMLKKRDFCIREENGSFHAEKEI